LEDYGNFEISFQGPVKLLENNYCVLTSFCTGKILDFSPHGRWKAEYVQHIVIPFRSNFHNNHFIFMKIKA